MIRDRNITPIEGRYDLTPFRLQSEFNYDYLTANPGVLPGTHPAIVAVLQDAILLARRCLQSDRGVRAIARALCTGVEIIPCSTAQPPPLSEMGESDLAVERKVREWLNGDNMVIILDTVNIPERVDGRVYPDRPREVHLNDKLGRVHVASADQGSRRAMHYSHNLHLAMVITLEANHAIRYQFPSRFHPTPPRLIPNTRYCEETTWGQEVKQWRGEGGHIFEEAYWGGQICRIQLGKGSRTFARQINQLACFCKDADPVYNYHFMLESATIAAIVEGRRSWQSLLPFTPSETCPLIQGPPVDSRDSRRGGEYSSQDEESDVGGGGWQPIGCGMNAAQ